MAHKNAHNDLSANFVREIFNYDPESGKLFWAKTLSKRATVGKLAGTKTETGRIKIGVMGKDYMAHRLIWVWMTGAWPKKEIDHINGRQGDNRWKNLRQATPSQNLRNRGLQKNNKSGFKGVCFDNRRKCWLASIKVKGRHQIFGPFATANAAHNKYRELAIKLHGRKWAKF